MFASNMLQKEEEDEEDEKEKKKKIYSKLALFFCQTYPARHVFPVTWKSKLENLANERIRKFVWLISKVTLLMLFHCFSNKLWSSKLLCEKEKKRKDNFHLFNGKLLWYSLFSTDENIFVQLLQNIIKIREQISIIIFQLQIKGDSFFGSSSFIIMISLQVLLLASLCLLGKWQWLIMIIKQYFILNSNTALCTTHCPRKIFIFFFFFFIFFQWVPEVEKEEEKFVKWFAKEEIGLLAEKLLSKSWLITNKMINKKMKYKRFCESR